VLVLDMIEVLPPLGKYKYDNWRILLVKCYIDNSVCLRSCIRNRRPRNAMTPDKKPSVVKNSSTKFSRYVKNATSAVTSSPVTPTT
jgi:hypothetical protein